jgi:hypothetical protein
MNYFEKHQLSVLCDTPAVQRFSFKAKATSEFGFTVTTAENLIVMTGDIGTLIIEPGYGRDGLAFLRKNLKNQGYFLGKAPSEIRPSLTEFKAQYAIEDLKQCVADESITNEQYESIIDELGSEDGQYGEIKYWELCSDYNIDEPPSATRLNPQVKLQLEGLAAFLAALDPIEKAQEPAAET